MTDITELLSTHLGKAGDGTVVKPYETPMQIDSSLLVAVPRSANREQYDIQEDDLKFIGNDVWHAYEFSTLIENGAPVSYVLKLVYPANSKYLVESKSLKLYLNSFNMDRFPALDTEHHIQKRIEADLSKALECDVQAILHSELGYVEPFGIFTFNNLADEVMIDQLTFNDYKENPSLLKFEVDEDGATNYDYVMTNILRSNCKITHQPDWGDVYIYIKSKNLIDYGSLFQYIVSFRNENHFHEEVCEMIYTRLLNLLKPEELMVTCLYTRRGGIDINPVRASAPDVLRRASHLLDATCLTQKTLRQ